jgi:starch-binding outer membrane protein, SusD/RagB family
MKIKLYIVFLLTLSMGCKKDLLNTIPNDRITSAIFWNEEKDAVLAANAIYNYLEGQDIFSWDAMSDIASANVGFLLESYVEKGIYDALTPLIENKWNNAYKGIRAANYFLENVDKVKTTNAQLIPRLKGEVQFIRAYLYLQLVSIYGDVPLITKTISIEEGFNVTRTEATLVWDFIGTELTAAAALLPDKAAEKGRASKGTALAFKARAMLYAKRYTDAAQAAKAVMDLNVSGLSPSYQNLFSYSGENNIEVLLDKQFVKDVYSNSVFALLAPYSQTADGSFVPVKKLVDAYEMQNGKRITEAGSGFDPVNPYKDRDPRLGYSVFVLGSTLPSGAIYDSRPNSGTADAVGYKPGSTKTGFNIKKYVNKEDYSSPRNSGINVILMRYAEVLLTYAEAKIEAGQVDASVFKAINDVRQRADVNLPPIVAPKLPDEMREIVRHERMVELAFEGQRYFDIRRWGIAQVVMNVPVSGMTYSNSSGNLVTINDPTLRTFIPNRDYLWPIPQKELNLNKSLKQNPNW